MFKKTKESQPAQYFSYETDSSQWAAITRGYNFLFNVGLSNLLSYGCEDSETDDLILLRNFFKEIEGGLKE